MLIFSEVSSIDDRSKQPDMLYAQSKMTGAGCFETPNQFFTLFSLIVIISAEIPLRQSHMRLCPGHHRLAVPAPE